MKMQTRTRAIDKIYKRRDRYEIPEWQRQEVWSRSKKQNLIDSILRGWKLPKFYFLRLSNDPEQYEVVDGQQRLAAIFEFFDNELELADDSAMEFGAPMYKDLPDNYSDAFDDFEIQFDEIEEGSEEEVKQFFQRLQDGLPLTSSEKLNSIPSKLRDFLMEKAKHPFFEKAKASDKRYGYFDILAKVAAIEIDGIEVGLRYDDLRAVFESQAAFSAKSNVAGRICSALDFVNAGFGPEQAGFLRNRTVIQSLLTLVCCLSRSDSAHGRESAVAEFFVDFLYNLSKQVELGQRATDLAYLRFQRTVNANIKDGARIREEVLLQKLLAYEPTFAEIFDSTAIDESGLNTTIKENGTKIANLIAEANARYSATHGEDLFKPTNRTVQAQARLAKPILDYDGYSTLIDDLYFLVHESVGERLKPGVPDAFRDVNTLRTELRHDVDHGKQRNVRAKRQKAGQVFAQYGGVPSPAGLAPERFTVVQANIVSAVLKDLHELVQRL